MTYKRGSTIAEHALAYLARADAIPHRTEGESILLDFVPRDGRLLALLKIDRPQAQAVALDFSPTMLAATRERFVGDLTITIVEHNMDTSLGWLRALGFIDVDCYWKWLELALLVGFKPS